MFRYPVMKTLCLLFSLTLLTASAADKPYDESANAKRDIQQALATAANKPVVVVFGANWCPDCLVLDRSMNEGGSAKLLKQDFKIVKVDVGRQDKNVELAASYGVHVTNGIPAVVILSPKSEIIYATKDAELSKARSMGDDGIYQFFKRATASIKKQE